MLLQQSPQRVLYKKNGFKVPQIAVKQDQNDVYVLLVKNGKVEKSSVHISYQNNEYAIIDKGLQNDDKIILDNFKKNSSW